MKLSLRKPAFNTDTTDIKVSYINAKENASNVTEDIGTENFNDYETDPERTNVTSEKYAFITEWMMNTPCLPQNVTYKPKEDFIVEW